MGWWGDLRTEFAVLKGAPWSAAIILVLGLAGGGTTISYLKGQEVTNAQTAEHAAEAQRDEYKDASNGADPAQLQATLTDLMKRVGVLEQKVLGPAQVSALKTSLSTKPSNVTIAFAPLGGASYAKELSDVFTKSGWAPTVAQNIFGPPPGKESPPVILNYDDPTDTATLEAAFQAAKIPYEVRPDVGAVKQIWLQDVPVMNGPSSK